MSKNIKLLSAAALAATVITPAMAVEAATPVNQDGVYFVYEGQNTYMTLTELVNNPDMSYYVSELGLDKVTVIQDGEAGTYQDFLSGDQVDLENYNLPAGEYKDSQGNTVELTGDKQVGEVTSVKAITETVDKDGTLEFTINEGKTATVKELTEAGYDVTFNATKAVFKDDTTTSKDGVLATQANTTFEYEVVVTKDGEEVAKSARQKVTVEDFESAIIEITSVEVTVNNNVITSNKLAVGEEAQLKVMGKTKLSKDKSVDITENVKFAAAPVALISVSNEDATKGKVTQTGKKGDATVTITSGDLKETVKLNVGNEARKASATTTTISEKTVEVAAGQKTKIIVDVKDQYGDVLATAPIASNAEKTSVIKGESTGVLVTDAEGETVTGKYEIEATAADKAAKGDIIVKVGDVEVGKVNVTVKEAGAIDKYEFTTTAKEWDLKQGVENNPTVALKAFDKEGLEVSLAGKAISYEIKDAEQAKKFAVDSSTGVVTKVEDAQIKAGDKVVVSAIEKEGAIETVRGTVEITVVDTTPVLKDVTFTSHPAVTEATSIDLDKILKVTAEGSKGEVKVAYTVAKDEKALTIVEAGKDGKAPETGAVELGTVELTNLPEGLNVKFAEAEQTGKVTVDVALNTAADENAAGINKGSFNIAVIDKADNFVKDTNVDVNLTTVDAKDLATKVEELKFYVKGIPATGAQTPVTIAEINEAMKDNNVEIKAENLQLKDGKLSITGPLLTPEAWETLKSGPAANKDIPYRVTVATADGTKAFKIAISKDGTAVFEAIKQ